MRSQQYQDPFGQAGRNEAARPYGAAAGTRQPVCAFASRIAELIERTAPAEVPGGVTAALRQLLAEADLLSEEQRQPSPGEYARHILYADPLRRFTILSLVWLPEQATPVHGHTAWGAVGLYEGALHVTNYQLRSAGLPALECVPVEEVPVLPGQAAGVHPGIRDIHRIANGSARPAISLHVYGQDLLRDPGSVNIVLPG